MCSVMNFCLKISPFPRVRTSTSSLPDEEKLNPVTQTNTSTLWCSRFKMWKHLWLNGKWIRSLQKSYFSRKSSTNNNLPSPSALKVDRMGAAISSSTEDSILLSPSITQGVCGRLRQNLLYLPEDQEEKQSLFCFRCLKMFVSYLTSYKDRHMETLDVLRGATAAWLCWRTWIVSGEKIHQTASGKISQSQQ